jgi:hypothetical protein
MSSSNLTRPGTAEVTRSYLWLSNTPLEFTTSHTPSRSLSIVFISNVKLIPEDQCTLVLSQSWLEKTPTPTMYQIGPTETHWVVIKLTERTNFRAGIVSTILPGVAKSDVDSPLGSCRRGSDANAGAERNRGAQFRSLARH